MGVDRVLLDTHTLLWALMQPELLSKRARAVIEETETELWVSAASAWELATKYRLGRLPEAEEAVFGYEDHVRRLGARELPVSSRDALQAGLFTQEHRDPFDRILAAQAIAERMPIVTKDQHFGQFEATVWW